MWEQLLRLTKLDSAIVLFSSQPFTSALIMSNVEMFKYTWIWDKTYGRGHLVAKYRPMQQTEDIVVFGKGTIVYNPLKEKRDAPITRNGEYSRTTIMGGRISPNYKNTRRRYQFRNPTNLLTFKPVPNSSRNRFHPTQKPVKLIEYLVQTYTNPGDVILDFTMGSGTTGVACVNLDREFIGIEIDNKMYTIAKERIHTARKQKKLDDMEQPLWEY